MASSRPDPNLFDSLRQNCTRAWQAVRERGTSNVQFWFIALVIGAASGGVAVGFRMAISALQTFFYGENDVALASAAAGLPWWWVLCLPILGGLVVGIILNKFTPEGRVRSVADVIEGAALHRGRVEVKAGLGSALASLVTLSTGGSTGREGPVVHLAAVLATTVSNKMNANGITGRDLLGCAVAGAVSASFNAPIAGALFALEVVLRHFALHAFAPIVIASVVGTVVSRVVFGDVAEFVLTDPSPLVFYVELPAFLLLGLVSGLVAVGLMNGIFWSESLANRVSERLKLRPWLRPAVSGALLGVLAIGFPHIIGVGYQTTFAALSGDLLFHEAIVFAVLKCVAVAITFAGRMGGGVFSPALMVGALTGLAFGIVATSLFPAVSGSETLYALAGMGAVAAAVLGAPISTTLIVFELTGDWQTGLAVMTSVSLSTALASRMVDHSFFLTQLERRGAHLAAGPQAFLPAMFRVKTAMLTLEKLTKQDENHCYELLDDGMSLQASDTLEEALTQFDLTKQAYLPVLSQNSESEEPELVGAVYHVDALKVLSTALADAAREEHS